MPESTGPRLEKGPAFKGVQDAKSKKTENAAWPTYRQNAKRSGAATSEIPAKLSEKWEVTLGGKVTPPVIADGQLIVAQCDAHRVCSLDAKTGKERWTFTAGGRIDSVPTIHRGTVLFGCRDG